MTRDRPQRPDTALENKPWSLEYACRGRTTSPEASGGSCPTCGHEDLSPDERQRFDLAKKAFHDQVDAP